MAGSGTRYHSGKGQAFVWGPGRGLAESRGSQSQRMADYLLNF